MVGDAVGGEILLLRASLWVEQGERDAADRTFQQEIARLELSSAGEVLGAAHFRYAQALGAWVRVNVQLAEAPGAGQAIGDYDSSSRGAQFYRLLAEVVRGGEA